MGKIWQLLRDYWQYAAMGVLAILVFGVWAWAQLVGHTQAAKPVQASVSLTTTSSNHSSSGISTPASTSTGSAGYVYISGAVRHPGLYHVRTTTRWADVVQAAGGLTDDADSRQVNLARYARDQENLSIPAKGEQAVSTTGDVAVVSGSGNGGSTNADAVGKQIDLNAATLADLQTISGVGPKRAQDIIDYRDQHGGFKSVDELKDISGIGDKIFADLEPHLMVGSAP
ncbi:ComE operon protein 1 [Lacticaseibacillus pantheris DSM 15945 = JCM 12539 = NBRC 106106]|jgi:competence protein ComEA|uniref:ComE operon protein 1 n=1 Tax=Lacticaseibacillus pantheris DSM 15945 = JCM 12539 = NBRC 106106 TaxID=1423783 RepID=A0A0R1TWD7_9LACO|nr:helix-hairpin-helix domain-containing protein [Lacticaseibacillus pantheris]KRL85553.1 ComE operon protein 1 [Lacticaseibacillus pantheris DSM 15945 = JCM 12539 = NBRC 106106]